MSQSRPDTRFLRSSPPSAPHTTLRQQRATGELLTTTGRLTIEAHNPEGSYQRNAGFSPKAKGSPPRAEAETRRRVGRALAPYVAGRNDVPNTGATGLSGLRPPRCGTQRYPNPIPWKPTEWGGYEIRIPVYMEVQPASGTRVCAK